MVRNPAPIALFTEKDRVVMNENVGSGANKDEGFRDSIGMMLPNQSSKSRNRNEYCMASNSFVKKEDAL